MKIIWHTEKRLLSELIPFESNPRQLTEEQHKQLKLSLEKFNLAEIPVINTDNEICAGHQRIKVLMEIYGGDYEIDVRVPNRKLTEDEFKEYNIRSNKNSGEWDWNVLANVFDVEDLTEWGFSEAELLGVDDFGDEFSLPDGDKPPFQQMTFTLADEQAEQIKIAIGDIKQTDEYKYCETMDNENSNGNALYLIVRQWAEQKK